MAFNPVKDAELASLGADGVVKFWDVRTKASVNEVKGLGTANSMAWDPDGVSLLVSSKVCCFPQSPALPPWALMQFTGR